MQATPPMHEPPASYDPVFFDSLFAVEDHHFWFRARNHLIAAVLSRLVADLSPGYRVLEVGCGTGNTLRVLEQVCSDGHVMGMDLFREGMPFARQRVACPLVQGDMQQPPFRAGFEVIGLFDVLEHLPDDRQVLRDLHAMLAPGGTLFLTVPAYPSLWSYFDEASCHYRRYGPAELARKLEDTGYRVAHLTPYMASLFPLVWVGRRVASLMKRDPAPTRERTHELARNELRIVPLVNEVLSWVLTWEVRLVARGWVLPFGASVVGVAQKAS
ncbi:MAG: class I SAM-dependent methyltransferase [Chloroflexaceae bacterium]|nr:class I SAM-dependent methyltransferase [Chloroflexaceae bacterium]